MLIATDSQTTPGKVAQPVTKAMTISGAATVWCGAGVTAPGVPGWVLGAAHDPCVLLGGPGKELVATVRAPSGCMITPNPAMMPSSSYGFSADELRRWRASVPSQRTAHRPRPLAAVRCLAAEAVGPRRRRAPIFL